MNQPKPLRQAMPTVAACVDELREAIGVEMINEAIRNGMAGGSDFYASENGRVIGHRLAADPARSVNLADCQIGPNKLTKEKPNGRY